MPITTEQQTQKSKQIFLHYTPLVTTIQAHWLIMIMGEEI